MFSMMLSEEIAPHLPLLRRYARALAGSQESGDAYVVATLESIVAAPDQFSVVPSARVALYTVFHVVWSSAGARLPTVSADDDGGSGAAAAVDALEAAVNRRLEPLTPLGRQALLLTAMEGFSVSEAARILRRDAAEVDALTNQALREIDGQTATSVLIIEDEPIIAMDLEQMVSTLGHSVSAVARTRDAAVLAARAARPGLVLADIQLADGSSGIDAVRDILGSFEVPVIFITAYPERLLTGQRPEPTFLITKPFQEDTVRAAISQALFFERTARVA
jgi:DNA-directed RNA polymerase specialized sigma24 family protein